MAADQAFENYRKLFRDAVVPERVAELRPGIVCVSICAYSHAGPWADRRGFDSIVQNVTGLSATQGSLAQPRTKSSPASLLPP